MTYGVTDQTLTATGAWTAASRGWQTAPNADGAEYQVTNPRVAAALSGSTLTLTLTVDDARTKPDPHCFSFLPLILTCLRPTV